MENELLRWLAERIPTHPRVSIGPGDDAALIRLGASGETLVTVDTISDGVDFHLHSTSPRRIGHKALAINLSDIAAMAGRPTAAVVALALPKQNAMSLAHELYEGLLPLAERYGVAIAGGDLQTWDGPLVISMTLLGEPSAGGPLTRRGARPGDLVVVTGAFGGSILGKHLDFEPRVAEAMLLHERYRLHAGMDVSDGLSLDLSRMCEASGCGAEIDLRRVPVSDAARQLAADGANAVSALEHALGDGEDFELLLAVPPDEAARMLREQPLATPLTAIGKLVEEPGHWALEASGRRPLVPRGYEH